MSATLETLFGLVEGAPHLEEALTHPSFANETGSRLDNQRLEFLGDAVLELFASLELWRRFPAAAEGELTRLRAQVVNADALAVWARTHELSASLKLGKGAAASGLADSRNVLADTVEALIAASYLDAGPLAAQAVCAQIVDAGLLAPAVQVGDPKTLLQERVQAEGLRLPRYEITESGGPSHDMWFRVRVFVGEHISAEGVGRSKRDAERAAAAVVLQKHFSVAQEDAP